MIRFAESAIQVMGKAGDHQVRRPKALGHAYGGGAQYYSMWVVRRTSRDAMQYTSAWR